MEANFEALFESELEGWYTDPELWPGPRSLETFREWFDIEYHSIIIDTVQGRVRKDDL